MILTSTKYHGNLLKDSSWSLLSLVKIFTSLETKKILKIPNRTFLKITRYLSERNKTKDEKKWDEKKQRRKEESRRRKGRKEKVRKRRGDEKAAKVIG